MYSHYWKWEGIIANPEAFERWSKEVEMLSKNLPEYTDTAGGYYNDRPLQIGGPNIHGAAFPVFSPIRVAFNGTGPHRIDEEELNCSVFEIRRTHMRKKRHYDFCPTGRKPYDLLVCAALIRLKYHFPSIKVGSDGTFTDWKQAVKLCQSVFGPEGGRMPFNEQEEFESPNWT